MTTEAKHRIQEHVLNSRHYLENALGFLQMGELGKAGELIWGSLAQALHAVAASHGMALKSHRSLGHFATEVAKELQDPSISQGYHLAERLHSNFYEVELEQQDIETLVEPIRGTVDKLLRLIPEELLREDT